MAGSGSLATLSTSSSGPLCRVRSGLNTADDCRRDAVSSSNGTTDHFTKRTKRFEEEFVTKSFGGRTRKIIKSAKSRHRTDISVSSWSKYKHYLRWDRLKDKFIRECKNNVVRLDGRKLSKDEFRESFENRRTPCVISHLTDDWPALNEWTLKRLREDFGDMKLKCGEDDDGFPIKVKLKHFLRYQNSEEVDGARLDDSPLYIFDSKFGDEDNQLSKSYTVPPFFDEDLFQLVGNRRPPYRWLLIGPARSGSNVHTDPLGTSAWNSLLEGRKLWTLFPPNVSKSIVKGKSFVKSDMEDDEPIDWNANLLPRMLEKHGHELRSKMIQFIQYPGETVYVPTNWHHGVLNLDDTVAVTQNFCSSGNFVYVWRHARAERRKMARKWLQCLRESRPDLAKLAVELDASDNYDLNGEILAAEKRREEKRQQKAKKLQRSK